MLVPPRRQREKIQVCGSPKVGKSSAAASIALLHAKLDTPMTTYWLDTDGAYDDMAHVLEEIPNLKVYQSYGTPDDAVEWWDELLAYCREIAAKAEFGDWIIFDKADTAWQVSAQAYDMQAWQKTQAEIRMENKIDGKTGWALYTHSSDDRSKWSVVKSQYMRAMQPLTLKSKGHLFFISEEVKVESSEQDSSMREIARNLGGYRPAGQKGLPYQVRTVGRIMRSPEGRAFTTWERLGRESVERVPYTEEQGFGVAYLLNHAGWKISK